MINWRPVACLGILALGACSGNTVRDTLGLTRAAPDEFRVVSRPPLSMPPQFDLRPPSQGASTPGVASPREQAQSLMRSGAPVAAGTASTAVIPVTVSNPGTPAESSFLQRAGAGVADPSVRDKLAEERYVVMDRQEDDSWWNFFGSKGKKEPIVNAGRESERIKSNTDSGKPVTEGETPEVKPRDTGLLGRIFDY